MIHKRLYLQQVFQGIKLTQAFQGKRKIIWKLTEKYLLNV